MNKNRYFSILFGLLLYSTEFLCPPRRSKWLCSINYKMGILLHQTITNIEGNPDYIRGGLVWIPFSKPAVSTPTKCRKIKKPFNPVNQVSGLLRHQPHKHNRQIHIHIFRPLFPTLFKLFYLYIYKSICL